MALKYRFVIFFIATLWVVGLLNGTSRGDEEAVLADESGTPALIDDVASRQFRIYREALLQGSTEQVRVDAAVSLLLDRNDASRQFLLDVLNNPDPPAAADAVCKALIKSRALGDTIGPRQAFLAPLLKLLASSNAQTGKLAADALLMFRYDDIASGLNEVVRANSSDKQARLNAVYAYQIRPEPAALRDLIRLRMEGPTEVAQAAEAALQEVFGIPVGTSGQVWQQILEDLQQKSPDDIRRERLLRQEMRLREVQAERDLWQKLYFALLDKQYETADDAGKMALISERLDSDIATIRLWAVGKVEQISADKLLPLRDKLLRLINDESRLVRLNTAKILSNMSSFDPAEKLLERLAVEKDNEVALAMFEALGEACFYAFSPGSKIKLPEKVRLQTLQLAEGYLQKDEPEATKKGAEIIRKLLEINNLDEKTAVYYLQQLAARFSQLQSAKNPLSADVLQMMSQLCIRGAQRQRAGQMYREFFEASLVSDNSSARLAAASGLAAVDAALAFRLFKQNNILKDASAGLRQVVFDTAAQVASAEDLAWLEPYTQANGQVETALAALKAICLRSSAEACLSFYKRIAGVATMKNFSYELLTIAESKGISDKNEAILPEIRTLLAGWYLENGTKEDLKNYLEGLQKSGAAFAFPDQPAGRMTEVLLGSNYYDLAIEIIRYRLERQSLETQSAVLLAWDRFFDSSPVAQADKAAVFERLVGLGYGGDTVWSQRLAQWRAVIGEPAAVLMPSN